MVIDPVTCPMCEGAIPGKDIRTVKNCPSCGADLSGLVRQRLAKLNPAPPPPPPQAWFIAQAAWFSLFAPCLTLTVYLLGRRALNESPVGVAVIGTVCSLVIVSGFIFGVVAFFALKGEKAGKEKAIAGIFINGLLISFVILSIFMRQNVAARESKTAPPRKGWSFISGN